MICGSGSGCVSWGRRLEGSLRAPWGSSRGWVLSCSWIYFLVALSSPATRTSFEHPGLSIITVNDVSLSTQRAAQDWVKELRNLSVLSGLL